MKLYGHRAGCFALSVLTIALGQAAYAADQNATTPVTTETQGTAQASLDEIVVTAPHIKESEIPAHLPVSTSDTAALLNGTPGVSLYSAGGVSSLPAIHGLADDRIKITVDGMQVTSACANHMNPPLSYVSPSSVSKIDVIAGITPVSQGGDSIGGTIQAETAPPVFATAPDEVLKEGILSAYARSNNSGSGGAFNGSVASDTISLGVVGSADHAGDYKDGHNNLVTSTYYDTSKLGVNFAVQGNGNLVTVKAGKLMIPDQGFVNQQMDMIKNDSTYFNLGYKGDFAWGTLDTHAYTQTVSHEMNIGKDKSTFPMPMFMPMDTHGKDSGYTIKANLPLAQDNLLRLGNEFHVFTLDDWWPPVAGTAPMMAPNTFQSINDGRRDRFSLFAELESKLTSQVTSLVGVRSDRVKTDTGNVQGYSTMMYGTDAAAFNAQSHARQDNNWDATAQLKFEPANTSRYELGYAHKTRSPSLYERYSWSTNMMASGMINWFGDGNFYVGNLNLRPEKANTISATADWHDASDKQWGFKVTPYYTYINDYIGENVLGTVVYGMSTFNQLQFANHNAQVSGVDVSGKLALSENNLLKGNVGYQLGKDLTAGTNLYHMMPLNGFLTLEHTLDAWSSALELQVVGKKTSVDAQKYEPTTGGYSLVNLRTSYQWKKIRIDMGVTNLFNKYYYPALGGVNFDNYMRTGWMGQIQPLTGIGRSINTGMTVKF